MTTSLRPLASLTTSQLGGIFDQNRANPAVLDSLLTELPFRRRKRAQRLAVTVQETRENLSADDVPFAWPSTDAEIGDGRLAAQFQPVGLLGALGYRVGEDGLGAVDREKTLDSAYVSPVSKQLAPAYREECGEPRSAKRLKKMADSIASFARNAKRKNHGGRYDCAIGDWEADLAYLKAKYYDGRWSFPWPSTRAA